MSIKRVSYVIKSKRLLMQIIDVIGISLGIRLALLDAYVNTDNHVIHRDVVLQRLHIQNPKNYS